MASPLRKSSLSTLGLSALAALALAVPVAGAEETAPSPTRAEYKTAVEPICQANARANSRILRGVRQQVQQGKLAAAGRRFIRASAALGKAIRQIAAVPKPESDVARLDKWIKHLREQRTLLRRVGQALRAGNKFRAQKLAVQLNRANNRANNTVISFGFRHCRIDSSKFL